MIPQNALRPPPLPEPPADPPLDPLAARSMRILISKLLDHYRARQKEVTDERDPD